MVLNEITASYLMKQSMEFAELISDLDLVSHEAFTPNSYYGADFVLKSYCQLPMTFSLPCVVPHGVYINPDPWEPEIAALLPAIFQYSETAAQHFGRLSNKIAVLSQVPFAYAWELFQQLPDRRVGHPNERRGSVYFPPHSTHNEVTDVSASSIVSAVSRVDAKFHPISVCIYWRDADAAVVEELRRQGFDVFCAGHMYDPLFLLRLSAIFSRHKYVLSSEFGSQFIYGVIAGCESIHLPGSEFAYRYSHSGGVVPTAINTRPIVKAFREISEYGRSDVGSQRVLVSDIAGLKYRRSPAELRRLFRMLEGVDRFGVGVVEGKLRVRFPAALLRASNKLARSGGRRVVRAFKEIRGQFQSVSK